MSMMDNHYRKQLTRGTVDQLIRWLEGPLRSRYDIVLSNTEIEDELRWVLTNDKVIDIIASEIDNKIKESNGRATECQAQDRRRAKCASCGYIYNPEKGDATSDISPDTPFRSLPEDVMQNNNFWTGKPRPSITWVCPSCGAGKKKFEILDST